MHSLHTTSRAGCRRRFLFGILCALLITLSATVQVVHAHDLDASSHPECSLCVISHASISPAAPVALPVVVEYSEQVQVVPPDTPRETFVFSFFSRPPPAAAAQL